jgi:hypothetical protein
MHLTELDRSVKRRASVEGEVRVSIWDIRGLETNFELFRKERFPNLSPSDAFERFVVRQELKDADLSDDEIELGIVDGPDDGGVDGIYFFVNRILIQDETDLPDSAIEAALYVFQAKLETGFTETVVQKMESFARDLLDHNRAVDTLTHLNVDVRDSIGRFRENYERILASPHTITMWFVYATKSDQGANHKVINRVNSLESYVRDQLSDAKVNFEFWGCQRLLAEARRAPKATETIEISKYFTTDDGSVVCLARLGSLAAFLRNEDGTLRRSMLEPNVRDYQGKTNAVNVGIRETLTSGGPNEFWWLNNRITILATKCSVAGNRCVVERPEVVNGLQTSYEVFQFFKDHPGADERSVLIRVIVPPDEQTRSKIIKATNFQTPVSEISLHATDAIHFDIEEKFRLYQLFYERRKGEYRELRKPVHQIISIQTLARAVIAIVLGQPNDARGSPMRILKNEESYKQVFSEQYNRDLYVVCILIQRQIDDFITSNARVYPDTKTDIKYYLSLCVACELTRSAAPDVKSLCALLPTVVKPIDKSLMNGALQRVMNIYERLGANDKVAKGPEMRAELLTALKKRRFPT